MCAVSEQKKWVKFSSACWRCCSETRDTDQEMRGETKHQMPGILRTLWSILRVFLLFSFRAWRRMRKDLSKVFCWLDAAAKYEFMMRLRSFNNFHRLEIIDCLARSHSLFSFAPLSHSMMKNSFEFQRELKNGIWILISLIAPDPSIRFLLSPTVCA